jgi:hypothetical protein
MKHNGPLVTLLAGLLVGTALLVASAGANSSGKTAQGTVGAPPAAAASTVGGASASAAGSPGATVGASPGATVSASSVVSSTSAPAATTTAAAPGFPAQADYAAHVDGGGATIAIAIRDSVAIAYLCNGRQVEAWLQGSVAGARLTMTGTPQASLTATYGNHAAAGTVTVGGRTWTFTAGPVAKPSGLYRASQSVRGAKVVAGWIVLPDGSQVGILDTDGVPAAAPLLDPSTLSASLNGAALTAVPIDGTTGSGFH